MKKIKVLGVIVSFILSFILHFAYNYIPNTFFSIITPVNESIWEHMKLLLSASIIFSIIEYIIYNIKGINYNNFLLSYGIANILGIILYLIIYIPIDDILGHNFIGAIILLFLIFIFIQIISYYIMRFKKIKFSNIFGLLLIILMYIVFCFFYKKTYNTFYCQLGSHSSYLSLK